MIRRLQEVKIIQELVPVYRCTDVSLTSMLATVRNEEALSFSDKPSVVILPLDNLSTDYGVARTFTFDPERARFG